jgi:small-conductance mechanosensitive channel
MRYSIGAMAEPLCGLAVRPRRGRPGAPAPLLAVLAWCLAAPAAGQEAPPPPEPEPQMIPVAQVVEAAQAADVRLAQTRTRAEPDPAIQQISEQLPQLADELGSLLAGAGEQLEGDPNRDTLERIEVDLRGPLDKLGGWSRTLAQRAEVLGQDLESLGVDRDLWKETRTRARSERAPEAVQGKIDEVLAAIAKTEKAVKGRTNEVIALRESVSAQAKSIQVLLDRLQERYASLREQLFVLDSPPLWTALSRESTEGGADMLDRLREVRREDRAAAARWVAQRGDRLVLLVVLSALMVVVVVALRAPARRLAAEDPVLVPSAQVLARPVAAALVVAMMTIPLLLPKTPPVIRSALALVLVISALRLLLPIVFVDLRRVLVALAVWYAVSTLRRTLVPDPLASRLILLVEAAGALALVVWMIRPAWLAQVKQLVAGSAWLAAIAFAVRASLATLAVAIVANVAGNVSLAALLSDGVLVSAWLAFILYGVGRVLDGLWAVLLRTRFARTLRMVRNHRALLRTRGSGLLHVSLVAVWAYLALEAFAMRDLVLSALDALLESGVSIGELRISTGGILGFLLLVWLSFVISRFARFVLEEDVLPRAPLPRGVPFAISPLARYTILVLGFLVAVSAAGLDMSRIAIVLGALGVGIGIGLQDVVNNFVSGLILLFERPVQVGDTAEVGSVLGEVRRIGLRSSTIRTWDGAEVVIPNSQLVSQQFTNWTLSDRLRRMVINVGVAYGTDPEKVIELLVGVAGSQQDVLDEPEPSALFLGFGDSSLNFQLRAWTARYERWFQLQSELTVEVNRALREAGIEIPFPQRDLHVRSVDGGLLGRLERPPAPPQAGGTGDG